MTSPARAAVGVPEGQGTGQARVSVIIPCRDERPKLPQVLAMLRAQTLPPDEIVVADGRSTDGSREFLEEAANDVPGLRVVDNPRRIVPAALNVALAATTGRYVARMDTHATYAPDYLETVVRVLDERQDVAAVGGAMATEGRGDWGRAIASTLRRRFGLGGASHRVGGAAGPAPHVFSGCYRREALEDAGGWDLRLRANEDFEADQRVARSGLIWLEPSARTTWYVRESLPALARQMWRYGYYKGLTLRLHPSSLKVRQLAPPLLVAGLAGLSLVHRPAAGAAGAAYVAAAAGLGARAAAEDGADAWRGALVPPVVHGAWGAGLLAGLLRFAAVRRR